VIAVRAATTADCEGIAEVDVESHRESYRGLLPEKVLEAATVPMRTEKWLGLVAQQPPFSIYVAEQDGRIVGYAVGAAAEGLKALGQQMELQAIYLLTRVKRQGIGGALLKTMVGDFLARGANSACVWLLRDNWSARRFYERFGAQFVEEKLEHFSDYDRAVVGYIWPDLREKFQFPLRSDALR